ncbi:LysM peptidoglycan-binding domain-containing protein [Mesorhizobium sp. M0185]|uniref:LysM peptidoglycan-binding domain-containing protein n=1 Tax=Mesorhizobium sp. M0185 TaxID=2956907 RepID=UPI0033357928
MRMLAFSAAVAIASVGLLSEWAAAQNVEEGSCKGSIDEMSPCFVRYPFRKPEAQQRFVDWVARVNAENSKYGMQPIEIPADFWKVAPFIAYWGYEFQKNNIDTVDVSFVQIYDASKTIEAVRSAIVNALSQGGCSYMNADFNVQSTSKTSIVYAGNLSGKVRACGDLPFGGQWKTDLAGISGSYSGALSFRFVDVMPEGRYTGRMVSNKPTLTSNVDVDSIFGINVNSVAGNILTSALELGQIFKMTMIDPIGPDRVSMAVFLNQFDQQLYRVRGGDYVDGTYLNVQDGAVTSRRYQKFLDTITKFFWSVQPTFLVDRYRSGFDDVPASPTFTTAYVARLRPQWDFEQIRADIETEIELIRSFGKEEEVYVVARGDTYWGIAKRFYGNGFYFHLLSVANGITFREASQLRVGQQLNIPPLYTLSPLTTHRFLAPTDTLYGLCKSLQPKSVDACLKDIVRYNPSVRRNSPYALEGIRLPPS